MAGSSEDWSHFLDQLLAGDREAFVRLNRLITGFLDRHGAYRASDDWEDLRQEVIVSLVANAREGRLREPAKFLGYLRILVRNKFADRMRREYREHAKQTVAWDDSGEQPVEAVLLDGADTTDKADLWMLVEDLVPPLQQVIVRKYGHGKTNQEIADETGIPFGTVKRRLREGLAILRARLREGGG